MQPAVYGLLSTFEERESPAATPIQKPSGKGSDVMMVRRFSKIVRKRCEYASKEDFASAFECERVGLQRLALLLTANEEAAKRCLILAFQECIASGSVFKGWVLSWARRIIIRNAINLVGGSGAQSFVETNCDADNGLSALPPDDSLGTVEASEAILDLPELDRFAFVICALERYSMHDCALLLGRSPREINEARQRAGNLVGQIDELDYSSHISKFVSSPHQQRR